MLNADRVTSKRLGSQIRSLHSHQSEQWCYEKAINELIRDRHQFYPALSNQWFGQN